MNNKKNKKQKYITIIGLCIIVLSVPGYGFCQGKTFKKVEKTVNTSITTRQKTQQKLDIWEQKKTKLIARYDRLKQEAQFLDMQNKALTDEKLKHQKRLSSLVLQKQESVKIEKDMLPFLRNVLARLGKLISNGLPFLHRERRVRIEKLKKIMDNADVSIAEKYRKIMEALFIEAGYGNTTEILRKKIKISGHQVVENVFRLGRISLFSLSLDHKSAAYFNMAENKWLPLDKKYITPIYAAMEMSRKQRSAELVSLPIGRLGNEP